MFPNYLVKGGSETCYGIERVMKHLNLILWAVALCPFTVAAQTPIKEGVPQVEGKQLFVPKELDYLRTRTDSTYSFTRMTLLPDFAIYWGKGFGEKEENLHNPPRLKGQNMAVDMANLKDKLEHFYHFFRDTLQFVKGVSNADKYRMMVLLQYSLDGTAYGGDYDKVIGAFWVAPNRIQDRALNCVAHELGHSFQLQVACDRKAEALRQGKPFKEWADGAGSFFEMTSQWMLWHVNPNWLRDETYHWEAFRKLTYKAFLHGENAYHSPYILEYWSEKRGLPIIASIYQQARMDEDVVQAYKRLTGLDQKAFNEEIFEACRRVPNLDFRHAYKETRPYVGGFHTAFEKEEKGWCRVAAKNLPEDYGFNVIPLAVPEKGKKVKVSFEGLAKGNEEVGWRYGFVGVDAEGKAMYSPAASAVRGKLIYTLPKATSLRKLYLVVMGAPSVHHPLNHSDKQKERQYPYRIQLKGTEILP